MLLRSINSGRNFSLNMDIAEFDGDLQTSLVDAIHSMAKKAREMTKEQSRTGPRLDKPLPNKITFPYARHSSYPELRRLVETFRPKDVWPCTVDELYWHQRGLSIRDLFGDVCSSDIYEHDARMNEWVKNNPKAQVPLPQTNDGEDTQHTASSDIQPLSSPSMLAADATNHGGHEVDNQSTQASKRTYTQFHNDGVLDDGESEPDLQGGSQASKLSARAYETRMKAFRAMSSEQGYSIQLISTTDHHTTLEDELGEQ